jgi:tRNA nucleotidyltransferase (CCA-adding enzyme)
MKIYQVGGSVRDELLGRKPSDKDWVVIGSSPEEMINKGFQPVGKDFPVFLHPDTKEEYALARTEKKDGKGYKGFKIYADKNVTLEEDLKRRDLTINSIAKTENGDYIDPFNGLEDLKLKRFRHTSNAFKEDPLRAFRLARFYSYSHLSNFKLHNETRKLIEKIVLNNEIQTLSQERVWIETCKALNSDLPSNFFKKIIEYKITKPFFENLLKTDIENYNDPVLNWLELSLQNNFMISEKVKLPSKYIEYEIILKKLILIISEPKKIVSSINNINVHRNLSKINKILTLDFFKKDRQYLNEIIRKVSSADFSFLNSVPKDKINEEKINYLRNILEE